VFQQGGLLQHLERKKRGAKNSNRSYLDIIIGYVGALGGQTGMLTASYLQVNSVETV